MKPATTTVTITAALALLFLAVGGLQLRAGGANDGANAAKPEQGGGGLQCSNAAISGTYGMQIQGTRPVPPCLGGGTETVIGVLVRTYDGAGNFTQVDNVKGSVTGITPDRLGAGTYQVSANCTAVTQAMPGPGIVIEERMVITQNSGQVRAIVANPLGIMVTAVGERIDRR